MKSVNCTKPGYTSITFFSNLVIFKFLVIII